MSKLYTVVFTFGDSIFRIKLQDVIHDGIVDHFGLLEVYRIVVQKEDWNEGT